MKKYCVILIVILTLNGCQTNTNNIKSKIDIINTKVDSLLNIMTLDEKIGQMNSI